jgi:hypothetical protein
MSRDASLALWNQWQDAAEPADSSATRDFAVLEQYKLYVELADRLTERRQSANSFFLTLNAFMFSAIGFTLGRTLAVQEWLAFYALVLALTQCLLWYRIINSYRRLSEAKFSVIAEFETILPAAPWTRAEWAALGEGKSPRKYRLLTSVERLLPIVFALAYLGVFLSTDVIDLRSLLDSVSALFR